MPTEQQFSLEPQLPFLKTGVMLAGFKVYGNFQRLEIS